MLAEPPRARVAEARPALGVDNCSPDDEVPVRRQGFFDFSAAPKLVSRFPTPPRTHHPAVVMDVGACERT